METAKKKRKRPGKKKERDSNEAMEDDFEKKTNPKKTRSECARERGMRRAKGIKAAKEIFKAINDTMQTNEQVIKTGTSD